MTNGRNLIGRAALAICLAAAVGLAASAPASAVLEYKMPAGRALTYQVKSEDARVMEVQGQTMDTLTASVGTSPSRPRARRRRTSSWA
jgi:hypothetical protein